MDHRKWAEFLEELNTFGSTTYTSNSWSEKIENNSALKNKLLKILTTNDDPVIHLNKRQIILIRQLLWELDLWKLQLPETIETLQFVLYFKRMKICETCQNIGQERTECDLKFAQLHNARKPPKKCLTKFSSSIVLMFVGIMILIILKEFVCDIRVI